MTFDTSIGWAVVVMLFAHFAGSMYWAGRVSKTLENHAERLGKLEDWRDRRTGK